MGTLRATRVRFGATILQLVPYPLLRDDFVFAESIGLDNAWAIDVFATSSDTNERGVESE